MIVPWLVYGVVVGGLIAAAAWLLETALRVRGLPARGVWVTALASGVALTLTAPYRAPTVTIPASGAVSSAGAVTARDAAMNGGSEAFALLGRLVDSEALMVAWCAGATVLLSILALAILRARLIRKRWPLAPLQGSVVRVAPATGPLVAGVIRPEIVVPRWLLAAPQTEQRLVMAHEREHLIGRDPLLLILGCLLVALLPWSPAAWWMLSRLRLAVELDCDRRVVQAGASRSEYGTVLLDVASRTERRFSFAPALLDGPSQLEKRLVIMTNRIPRYASARALLFTAGAGLLVLTACEASLPTSTQIEEMDVATAEKALNAIGVVEADEEVAYVIDGEAATAEEARALAPERIATVEVLKAQAETGIAGDGPTRSRVLIRTKHGAAVSAAPGETRVPLDRVIESSGSEASPLADFAGVLVIDGVVVDPALFGELDAQDIQSIEIIKGEAAARLYDSPRAQNGVIHITTKAGAGG